MQRPYCVEVELPSGTRRTEILANSQAEAEAWARRAFPNAIYISVWEK